MERFLPWAWRREEAPAQDTLKLVLEIIECEGWSQHLTSWRWSSGMLEEGKQVKCYSIPVKNS